MCSHRAVVPDPDSPEPVSDPAAPPAAGLASGEGTSRAPGRHEPVHPHCANCGAKLQGPFCHRCGQHDFDFHRSFGHLFLDALENFFHFDEKLFRNVVTLLCRPGALTADFNAGRRVAQMPPLRFYIFVSVLFFFVSFFGTRPGEAVATGGTGSPQERAIVRTKLDDALHRVQGQAGDPRAKARTESAIRRLREQVYDPTARPIDPQAVDHAIADEIAREERAEKAATHPGISAADGLGEPAAGAGREPSGLERFLVEKGKSGFEHEGELAESFVHALPKMLLVCLPFLALYTRFLFRRSGQVYLQHLVVALHFHTFIFLLVLVRDGWADLAGFASPGLAALVRAACNLWLFLYPFLMLRRLFANSWSWTIVKAGAAGLAYGLTLGLGFFATAAVLFLWL